MFSFNCSICKHTLLLDSLAKLRIHLRNHKTYGQLLFPLRCPHSETCMSTVLSLGSYLKHFETFHIVFIGQDELEDVSEMAADESAFANHETAMFQNENDEDVMSIDENDVTNENEETRFDIPVQSLLSEKVSRLANQIETEALEMIVELRSRGNVPFKVSVDVLDMFLLCLN